MQIHAIGKKQKASKFSNDWCPKCRLGQQIAAGGERWHDAFTQMFRKDQKENPFHASSMRMDSQNGATLLCLPMVPRQHKSYVDNMDSQWSSLAYTWLRNASDRQRNSMYNSIKTCVAGGASNAVSYWRARF